jgi:N4-gp56 family major capsid protein
MANVTTSAQISAGVNVFMSKVMLARARPATVFMDFAQQKDLPSRNSDTIKFRRQANLDTATVALTEGTTPAGQKMSVTDLTLQLEQYGDYLILSDKVKIIVDSPDLNDNADLLGQQMAETMDELVREMMSTTATVYSAVNGSNGNTPTELTEEDCDIVVESLDNNSGRRFMPMIPASTGNNTAAVGRAYWAIGQSKLFRDLKKVGSWLDVKDYAGHKDVHPSEVGATGNIRWVLTPLGKVVSGSPDVYESFVCAEDSYGVSKLSELTVSNMIEEAGGSGDPLRQRKSQGWKAMFGSLILNDLWLFKFRSTNN